MPTECLFRTVVILALTSGCNLTAPVEPAFRTVATPPVAAPPPSAAPVVLKPSAPAPHASGRPRSRDLTVVPAHADPTEPDPLHGRFTLEQASAGLAGTGPLVATIETRLGNFSCELLSREAPVTVANFVGLARGSRDFWDPTAGRWVRRPFYDGSIFHRVIPDFMIQGGDILRSGMGGPGFEFADENVQGHNAPGLLCMANHGPNTNGGQFFITEVAKPHLDGSYSIFGRCTPTELVARITAVESDRGNMPIEAIVIDHVRITRR
jgi:peptidyl-prolyl cis-trans isomerase A (cyclophilin A)